MKTKTKREPNPLAEVELEPAEHLALRLSLWGFTVTTDVIETWNDDRRKQLSHCLTLWSTGTFEDSIPEFLEQYEATSPELSKEAASKGREARREANDENDNPYPPGTILHKVWHAAFVAAPVNTRSLLQDKLESLLADKAERQQELTDAQESFRTAQKAVKDVGKAIDNVITELLDLRSGKRQRDLFGDEE